MFTMLPARPAILRATACPMTNVPQDIDAVDGVEFLDGRVQEWLEECNARGVDKHF